MRCSLLETSFLSHTPRRRPHGSLDRGRRSASEAESALVSDDELRRRRDALLVGSRILAFSLLARSPRCDQYGTLGRFHRSQLHRAGSEGEVPAARRCPL